MSRESPPRALAAVLALALAAAAPGPAGAQTGPEGPFGGFRHDAGQPIEITADSLAVDETAGTATFLGQVIAGQGTLRLTANKVVVSYGGAAAEGAGRIDRLRAEGGVFLSNGAETAKGEWADYDVAGGVVKMGGDVILTQGENAISGEALRIDLNAGTGEITGGRVRSVFTPPAGAAAPGGDGG